jgi:hypothetical protein
MIVRDCAGLRARVSDRALWADRGAKKCRILSGSRCSRPMSICVPQSRYEEKAAQTPWGPSFSER